MRRKIIAICTAAVLLGAGGLVSGCSSSSTARAPGLSQAALDKLMARQRMRSRPPEMSKKKLNAKALEKQGDEMVVKGELMAALYQYHRAVNRAAQDKKLRLRVRSKIGLIHLKHRSWLQATAAWEKVLKLDPKNALAWQGLGMARLGQRKLGPAEKALKKAVSLNPRLWKSYNALGVAYNWRKKPKLALAQFNKALAMRPRLAAIYNNRGLAYSMLGDLKQAERAFLWALKLKPNYTRAANNLGLLYARQKRYREALRSFKRGVGKAGAHNNLGCVLAWQGKKLEAKVQFRMALKVKPTYYRLAGKHLRQLSDRDEGETGLPIKP